MSIGFSPSESDDGVAVLNGDVGLDLLCAQLGFNPADFERCLLSKSFGIRSIVTCMFTVPQVSDLSHERGISFPYILTVSQAIDARDGLAKKLYSLLFDWLIGYINSTLKSLVDITMLCPLLI
jgi:myosin heavy subunit